MKYTKLVRYEIIVVDNSSNDGSRQMIKDKYKGVHLVECEKNRGFGTANNIGAKIANGKYLLFLNSDCLLIENSIRAMHEFMEKNKSKIKIGAVGAMLYDNKMNLNMSYHKFPTIFTELKLLSISLINRSLKLTLERPRTSNYPLQIDDNEVDFISGADLMVAKNVYEEFGGFDEKFFLYYEETDLQKRMSLSGYKRLIMKDMKFIHLEGGSVSHSVPSLKTIMIYKDSMYKYFLKHSSSFKFFWFYLFITPMVAYPLFSKKYTFGEKKQYFKMMIRW